MTSPVRLKVGLLGAGYILDSHAKALGAVGNVTIHAVGDLSRGRAAQAARKFGISNILQSIEEMADSDCDVVHILLPPALHIDAAFAMVEKGKSVFIEKPMGLDPARCAALCARADEQNVVVGVNHNFLFAPEYEALRASVKRGELGQIDHLTVNWHFELPILKFGPFDNWMLAAPANILFELGPHLGAFAADLVGIPEVINAVAGNPIALPGKQTVYRQWTVLGKASNVTVLLSISLTPGQPDRYLRLRGRGGSAQLDFGRGISWSDHTVTDNPVFDAYAIGSAAGRVFTAQARRNRFRRLRSMLSKRPDSNPFEESIFRSISAFYEGGVAQLDPRHDGRFATKVIELCEAIAAASQTGAPSISSISVKMPSTSMKPTVLVVGGTGFIGRTLVRLLVDAGYGVRVMTRNARAAAVELGDLPVELFSGSHGDQDSARRALEGIEIVYHLAKCDGKRWQDYVDGDVNPTRVLATESIKAGVKRFIYTGTISSYASDNARQVINNSTLVDPSITRRNHYARSKAACEALLQQLHKDHRLPLVILRPGVVIGPGSPPAHLGVGRFASETRVTYWGDGTTPLPLVLVSDVADALARAASVPGIDGQTLLLTSPPLMTARDYVEAVSAHLRAHIEARPRSMWRYWAADMIKETVKNLIRHPNRRWPSLHDWRCSSHCARYDSHQTEQVLGWRPVSDRDTMVARGIADTVTWFLR